MIDQPIDLLKKMVPPPQKTLNSTGNWQAVEQQLGLILPDDYKSFIELYGSGVLCKLLWIRSPFGSNVSIRDRLISSGKFYEVLINNGEFLPYPIYPEDPGLVHVGTYGDVDRLHWFTEGDSNKWKLVYFDRETGFHEMQGITLVQFMVLLLQGNSPLPNNVIGDEILNQPQVFYPE